jgi:hypothetical protein
MKTDLYMTVREYRQKNPQGSIAALLDEDMYVIFYLEVTGKTNTIGAEKQRHVDVARIFYKTMKKERNL